MRDFYNLEILLDNLKLFDIYKNRYIFRFLYIMFNKKFLNVAYLIES